MVSGFWHGANWTFIIWGLLNAIYIMPSIIFNTNRNNLDIVAKGKYLPTVKEFLSMGITFFLAVFAWIFFRANNVKHAISFITEIFSMSLFSLPEIWPMTIIILIVIFLIIEWLGREKHYAIEHLGLNWPRSLRWAVYFGLITIIIYYTGSEQQFIYFQF